MTLVKQLCHSSPRNKHEIKTGAEKKKARSRTRQNREKPNFKLSVIFKFAEFLAWFYILRLSIYFGNNQIFNRRKKGEKDIIIISCFFLVLFGSLKRVSFQAFQLFNSIVKLLMIRCQFFVDDLHPFYFDSADGICHDALYSVTSQAF